MNRNQTGKRAAFLAASFLAFGAAPALAQQPDQAGSESGNEVETIVVTAQYRPEEAIDVPLAVTAIGEDEIKNITAGFMTDIGIKVPNVFMSQGSISPGISIRGVTSQSNVNAGFPPAVGIYVDGVYQGRDPTFNTILNDVARVEVLRGPQGTLYGKNTIGGTINIITQDPTPEFFAAGDLTLGNLNLLQTRATMGGALFGETLMARVSYVHRNRDGFLTNSLTNEDLNDASANGGRLVLVSELSDSFRLRLASDYFKEEGTSALETGPVALGTLVPVPAFAAVPPQDPSDNVVQLNTSEFFNRELYGVSAQADLDLGPATLTGIGAYRQYTSDFSDDSDGLLLDGFNVGREENAENSSFELRLTSNGDNQFNWLVGAYYYVENIENIRRIRLGPAFPQLLAGVTIPPLQERGNTFSTIESSSYALYGHADLDITERLHLGFGARWTHEEKDFFYHQFAVQIFAPAGACGPGGLFLPCFAVPISPTTSIYEDERWTYDASLSFDFAEDAVGYVRYARGFKAGGFQTDVISPPFLAGDPLGFLPEFVDNYEIGLKTFWFDRRLGLNIAVFTLDWQDKQEQIFTGTSFLIRNAASAKSQGVEVELIARPTKSLTLDANVAYLDAHYEDFPTNPASAGKTFPGLPDYSGSIGLQWTHPIEPGAQFTMRGDIVYTGQSYTDTTNTLTSDGVTTFNGRIGVESDDERWGLYAWGRNLSDEVGLGGGQTFPFPNSTIVTRGAGLGRTFGLELRARY